MTTPLSDDAMDSVDKIAPRHVFEARIEILVQRDSTKLSLQGWARNLSESGLSADFSIFVRAAPRDSRKKTRSCWPTSRTRPAIRYSMEH